MDFLKNVRSDFETAQAVSKAMVILAEFGYARAQAYFKEVGIRIELAERMLLIRYDRRRPVAISHGQNHEAKAPLTNLSNDIS